MLLRHPAHPGRGVRLAYSQNVHPAASVGEVLSNLRAVTVPLRDRLGVVGDFGVGLYLAAPVAYELESEGSAGLRELAELLRAERFDPFTYNAFPYLGFGAAGMKAAVFDPPWSDLERAEYSLTVARVACALARELEPGRHVSISTHTGGHSSRIGPDDGAAIARGFAATTTVLAHCERAYGVRIVLSLEPEPRANLNDLAALAEWRASVLSPRGPIDGALAVRHLGTCLDACHAAVEFEEPSAAFEHAVAHRAPLGKLQFTSALALREPARNDVARERFFALDEPRYLHQVTARGPRGFARAGDLDEARAAWGAGEASWREADEWRCHFHVPTDLVGDGEAGWGTTADHAAEVLAVALAAPERWGTDELHVEIETYTWSILTQATRGAGELIDGLEREYRHVLGLAARAGWKPV